MGTTAVQRKAAERISRAELEHAVTRAELVELTAGCIPELPLQRRPVSLVLARYGPATSFPEVKGRFRCSACGSRQVDVRPGWSRRSPGQITRHIDR